MADGTTVEEAIANTEMQKKKISYYNTIFNI